MSKKLQYLIIHCTATPEGREVSSAEIRRWHTNPKSKGGRGWKQVGYRKMYHLDGKVEELVENNNDDVVDSWEITNGAIGYNSVAQHWVIVGGTDKNLKTKDTRTNAQKEALERDIKEFHESFPDVKIVGHGELAVKDCPAFNVQQWLKEIGIKN